jgi:hypothetical protein
LASPRTSFEPHDPDHIEVEDLSLCAQVWNGVLSTCLLTRTW